MRTIKMAAAKNDVNILEPIVGSIWDCIDVIISKFIKPKFSIEKYFKEIQMKNKQEVYPTKVNTYMGDKGEVQVFTIPPGFSLKDFQEKQDGLESQLNKKIEIRYKNKFIEIEVIDVELPKIVEYVQPKRMKDSICIPIGGSLNGDVLLDLKENPHSYIVGTTGSGKSVCTKGILTSLITMYKPHELEIYLGDLKRVELNLFANVKHCKRFVYTVEDVTELIADLLAETNKRYDLFMEHGVTSIFEYNKLEGVKKLKYQVLYLEEIVILLEDGKKRAMKLLKQLIAISRASGLYVFLTTQRPSNDVIDNVVKANINNRIVFKCEDSKNSIVALDREGAEALEGKGHGLLKQGANITEFRSYFIEDTEVKELILPYVVDKKITQDTTAAVESLAQTPSTKADEGATIPGTTPGIQLDLSFLD
ncbi:MAG: DNA translocase FtsK [Romboutsia sp.]|nr:DNA translocase FtsK [Romboutsia sp.]